MYAITSRDPAADLFDKKLVGQLLKRQRGGFLNTNRLYALAFVELWRKSYQISAGCDPASQSSTRRPLICPATPPAACA